MRRVLDSELIIELEAAASGVSESELYSCMPKLIQFRFVSISAMRIMDFHSIVWSSKPLLNIDIAYRMLQNRTQRMLAAGQAELTLITVYWWIRFNVTENNLLYKTLLTSFKIYSILSKGVSAVLIVVTDTNQKSKTEIQVQTRVRRLFIFKKSSLIASGGEDRDTLTYCFAICIQILAWLL